MSRAPQQISLLRWVVLAAGLMGAAGVALSAAAAHGSEARLLGAAAAICLAHAPALLVLGTTGRNLRLGLPCASLLTAGTVLFAGDLVLRASFDQGLFPMAAPTGGIAMILGWLTVALGVLLPRRDD